MRTRHIVPVVAVAVAWLAFIFVASSWPNSSMIDIVALTAIGLFFTGLVFVMLISRGSKPVDGHRGLPRSFWVLFASFGVAWAPAMLLSIAAMPWVGTRGFDFFFDSWWAFAALAAIAFPFVRRRLL
jgi:hypothetical protein